MQIDDLRQARSYKRNTVSSTALGNCPSFLMAPIAEGGMDNGPQLSVGYALAWKFPLTNIGPSRVTGVHWRKCSPIRRAENSFMSRTTATTRLFKEQG
jgi:hypothetical protein